jgi:hypothetical protein
MHFRHCTFPAPYFYQRTSRKFGTHGIRKFLESSTAKYRNQHRLDTIRSIRLCEDIEVPEHFSSVAEWRQAARCNACVAHHAKSAIAQTHCLTRGSRVTARPVQRASWRTVCAEERSAWGAFCQQKNLCNRCQLDGAIGCLRQAASKPYYWRTFRARNA